MPKLFPSVNISTTGHLFWNTILTSNANSNNSNNILKIIRSLSNLVSLIFFWTCVKRKLDLPAPSRDAGVESTPGPVFHSWVALRLS